MVMAPATSTEIPPVNPVAFRVVFMPKRSMSEDYHTFLTKSSAPSRGCRYTPTNGYKGGTVGISRRCLGLDDVVGELLSRPTIHLCPQPVILRPKPQVHCSRSHPALAVRFKRNCAPSAAPVSVIELAPTGMALPSSTLKAQRLAVESSSTSLPKKQSCVKLAVRNRSWQSAAPSLRAWPS